VTFITTSNPVGARRQRRSRDNIPNVLQLAANTGMITMPAGYSKRSLVEKLGIKAGTTVAILHPPTNYASTLGPLPGKVRILKKLQHQTTFIQFFAREREVLQSKFPELKRALAQDGMLWISWPKRASNIATGLDGNIVREIGLQHGLVDVKVCAVDETWSGLKFVYRVKDRQ
jgi:hypothetical protein